MFKKIGIIALTLLISACSSSTKVSQQLSVVDNKPLHYSQIEITNQNTEAPEHFAQAVKSYLKQLLQNTSKFDEEKGHTVKIDITDYRMRSGFSRAMFGMFAGKDGVDSKVTVTDESGKVLGESTISSFNIMAVGDMQDIARMHAEEIAKFLHGGKS